MRCPTIPTLMKHFPLTRAEAAKIRKLAKLADDGDKLAEFIEAECPETQAYVRQCYNDPFDSHTWRVTMALHAIDRVLGTLGVEPLGEVNVRNGPPYEFCNTGDTYATTLIYKRDTDTLFIGNWGDLVERHPELC